MNLFDLLNEEVLLEIKQVPEGKRNAILFDIDDTLVTAKNIYIWKKFPNGKEERLTPDEFAKENIVEEEKKGIVYDLREFRDPKTVINSIKTGDPIVRNLRILDAHINAGWVVGILTARGLEDSVYQGLQEWLMFRNDKTGKLEPMARKLARNIVHAVNDSVKQYSGINSFEKKANVIREYSKKYNKVKFVDDDDKNVSYVKEMAEKENLKNIIVVKAWRN